MSNIKKEVDQELSTNAFSVEAVNCDTFLDAESRYKTDLDDIIKLINMSDSNISAYQKEIEILKSGTRKILSSLHS